jgi:hypothetical protein
MVSINIKISLFSPLLHVLILILISARDNGKCVAFGTFEINRSWTSKKGESHQHRTLIERHATQNQYRGQYRDNNTSNRKKQQRKRPFEKKPFQQKQPYVASANDELDDVLQKCHFGSRLLTLSEADLPTVAEVHADGKWQLCIITGFKVSAAAAAAAVSTDNIKSEITPPLIKVLLVNQGENYDDDTIMDKNSCVVDIGQITGIWKLRRFPSNMRINDIAIKLSAYISNIDTSMQKLPVNHIEKTMQILYEECIPEDKRGNTGLTKKDVSKISSAIEPSERAQHFEQILRRALKAGFHDKKLRLVDTKGATEYLFEKESSDSRGRVANLLVGATLLARDAELCGRFKRSGCIFVSAKYDHDNSEVPSLCEICILNGGWTAVDTSVRAGTEARKFAEKRTQGKNNDVGFTAADERILYRLECFAMGEVLENDDGSHELELDLRETLTTMGLPLTTKGAQSALIQSGRWSPSDEKNHSSKKNNKMFEPWSNDVLESARMLVESEEKRKKSISKLIGNGSKQVIEDRVNLVALPVVCVDAKRASFRDDAIGVRPRSSTGRKIVKAASKWEILVHIADVSDLYSPEVFKSGKESFDAKVLRKAAEGRGASRYDLPFGPLHLMPPVALEALSLVTRGTTSKSPLNRCVTLWAYIDERNGKLIDAGLERTIISAPIGLTFESASAILEGEEVIDLASTKQARAVLGIAERNLSLWKENRLQTEKAAANRENRLQMKEMIAREITQGQNMRDDGAGGSFQRTRGHRLVDQSLDLYGSTLSKLLSKANAPIPRASGSSADRDGRVATAPLRRYIDGLAQRQALSVLCDYGGPAMTQKDCKEANQKVNDATNKNRKLGSANSGNAKRIKSLKMLESHLATIGNSKKRIIPALSTGKQNEVVISGLGIVVKCHGVKGSLRSGKRVSVEITKLNAEKGLLQVQLSNSRI